MRPVLMPPNRLAHFYLGGEAITRLRQVPAPAERSPEEWLASTSRRHGEDRTGLSTLPDGRLLLDAVREDPYAWTGGPMPGGPGDVGVLVKLLDAGQRLPVHVHPDRRFAGEHLHSCYGKTEAWYVLQTAGADARVYLGFRDDVESADLRGAVDAQDTDWMLERMNRLDVSPGDVILVPAGTAHAIGSGVFVVEVQEPTDLSVLLEFEGFSEREDAFLGLGVDGAVAATRCGATGPDRLAELCRHVGTGSRADEVLRLLPTEADEFFRADLLAPADGAVTVAAGFGVLMVIAGNGSLRCDDDGDLVVSSGDVVAVPHAAGDWRLVGTVSAVLCRPSATPGTGTTPGTQTVAGADE